jgi:hypothetical protein
VGKINVAVMLTISLYSVIQGSFMLNSVLGQTDNSSATAVSNILNNNPKTEASSNSTGIMHNTSGIIDDAFDALKDSFATFFGGN